MNNIIRRPFRDNYFYGAVYWLIGINVLIFALMMLIGDKIIYLLEIDLTKIGIPERRAPQILQISISGALGMSPVVVLHGWIWTFVTYMFMHGNVRHILFNMLGLFLFGLHVERQMGSKEFILYYLVTGILAGVFSFAAYYLMALNEFVYFFRPLVGASGALFAVTLAYAVFFPNSIVYIWGIIPLRAPVMVLGYTALELFFSVRGRQSNVAHLTHLAGFAFGWLYFVTRYRINPWKRLTGR